MPSHPDTFAVVPDAEALLRPGRHLLVRRRFFSFAFDCGLHGTVIWGRLSELDIAELVSVWDAHQRSSLFANPTLTDLRDLEWVDVLAFEKLLGVLHARKSTWTARSRQSVLVGMSPASAMLLGALQLVGKEHRFRAFEAPEPACEWIERADFAPTFERLRASVLGSSEILRRVRATFDESAQPPAASALARKLGLSVRSLQRHLSAAGTSLRTERAQSIASRAEHLLEGTDLDLAAIAATLGVSSPAQLVKLFRSARGTTPGAFRREHRQTRARERSCAEPPSNA